MSTELTPQQWRAYLRSIGREIPEPTESPPPAPAAPPPSRTPAPYRFNDKAASHEQRVRLHKVSGLAPPEEPSPSAMVRQQALHPGERRKLLRGFEENEVYL